VLAMSAGTVNVLGLSVYHVYDWQILTMLDIQTAFTSI